jgi:hypothetical protein
MKRWVEPVRAIFWQSQDELSNQVREAPGADRFFSEQP